MTANAQDAAGDIRLRFSTMAQLRRGLVLGLTMATILSGLWVMWDILCSDGANAIELLIITLFVGAFSWISISFWSAMIGVALHAFSRDPIAAAMPLADPGQQALITTRTALVMPVYCEAPEQFLRCLESTYRSLLATGAFAAFDIHVLSDTPDGVDAERERKAWAEWRSRTDHPHQMHYRRRSENIERKAGNIMEFCDRAGDGYHHFLVLDADSTMLGETIVRLVRLMQANPDAGIIQTVPVPSNSDTAFTCLLRFISQAAARTFATGYAWWQLGESNYYGHNALIRLQPFRQHCRLPTLSGRGPFSGQVLSHDFVEAAFMRRAGYRCWLLPDAIGSHEDSPPTLIDYIKRDRRWAQGNLQHLRLLFVPGLHPMSRLHFLLGVLAYANGLFWLILLALSIADLAAKAVAGHDYFGPGESLFPTWPVAKTNLAIGLFVTTMAMLALPKLLVFLGQGANLVRAWRWRALGRFVVAAGAETVFAAMLAPVLMVHHARFIILILLGRKIEWRAQGRTGYRVGWWTAISAHAWHYVFAIGLTAAVAATNPGYLWWLTPILAGLLLSAPLAVATSCRAPSVQDPIWPDPHTAALSGDCDDPPEREPQERLIAA
ncbi:MAG: glucans biosynthesis glucosyltransferase MdoH [Alphaproteobacteria bacterium]